MIEENSKLADMSTIDSSEDGSDQQIEVSASRHMLEKTLARNQSCARPSRKCRSICAGIIALAGTACILAAVLDLKLESRHSGSSSQAAEIETTNRQRYAVDDYITKEPTPLQTPAPTPNSSTDANRDINSDFPSSTPSISAAPTPVYPFPVPHLDDVEGVTRFYGIADIPYTEEQHEFLKFQIDHVPDDAEFIVHLGDIRSADDDPDCKLQDYTTVANTLLRSPVPVFIIPGDNEWNDCNDPDSAWKLWEAVFMFFEDNWGHDFKVRRMPGRNETFAFINKGTLFIGLNIVGGTVHDRNEWHYRLSTQAEWVKWLIRYYDVQTDVGRVVLFGHADPTEDHDAFFHPLKEFLHSELQDKIPVLVLNGDLHVWKYQSHFFEPASSMLRVMLTGEGIKPMHQITINASNADATFSEAFAFDY